MHKAPKPHTKIKDALDHGRAAAQELHSALSDAVRNGGETIKGDLEGLVLEAKAIAVSMGGSLEAQSAAAKKAIDEAVVSLEATATHTAQATKSSGHDAERSIQQAISDARGAVQKISEAVAEKRSAASTEK
ncbi:hypothetical protein [Novosphingobium sp.]|uniref:hypothetical protein n=1 Tax=Novosphingobium sp. TaxID=1874826 RepID=UPI002609641D|nr:hypothetical protein [Novosphingobium sp.]